MLKVFNEQTLPLISLAQLSLLERKAFQYMDQLGNDPWQPRLVRYEGKLYDIHATKIIIVDTELRQPPLEQGIAVLPSSELAGWHAFISETLLTGLLLRIGQDDTVTCATFKLDCL